MFWDSPFYKPKNKICDDAWDDFISAAKILLILDHHRTKEQKSRPGYREPDVYAVFNKLRQDYHNELPYSRKFIAPIDKSVERDIERERKSERFIAYLPDRD